VETDKHGVSWRSEEAASKERAVVQLTLIAELQSPTTSRAVEAIISCDAWLQGGGRYLYLLITHKLLFLLVLAKHVCRILNVACGSPSPSSLTRGRSSTSEVRPGLVVPGLRGIPPARRGPMVGEYLCWRCRVLKRRPGSDASIQRGASTPLDGR